LATIAFHSEHPSFKLKDKTTIKQWLLAVIASYGGKPKAIQYIFCNDEYLLEVNQQYLQHDTLTDIITFRYQEHPQPLESDIYISTERVQENALKFAVPFETELRRVMVHGVLHLLGLKDKSPADKQKMREAEERALESYCH